MYLYRYANIKRVNTINNAIPTTLGCNATLSGLQSRYAGDKTPTRYKIRAFCPQNGNAAPTIFSSYWPQEGWANPLTLIE